MELPIQLAMKLGPALRSPRTEVGLAYQHFLTGAAWQHNDRRFPAGDLVVLPIAMAAFKAVADGRLSLAARAGKPRPLADVTIRELLYRLVVGKDALAGQALTAALGAGVLETTLSQWGLDRTIVSASVTPASGAFPALTADGSGSLFLESGSDSEVNGDARGDLGPGPNPSIGVNLGIGAKSGSGATPAAKGSALKGDAPLQRDTQPVITPGEMASLLARLVTADGILPEHAAELLTYLRLAGGFRLPRRPGAETDPVVLQTSGDGFCHLCLLEPGPRGHLRVVLTEGKAGEGTVAKIAGAIASYYAGVEANEERLREILSESGQRLAPDPRLEVWDVAPRWTAGGLELVGRTTALQWPEVRERCEEAADVAIADRVRVLDATPPYAVALAPVVHLRRGPGHAAELVSQLAMGALVDVLEAGDDWWLVRSPDGTVAHARSTNLKAATAQEAERWKCREQLLVTAPLVAAPRLSAGRLPLSAGTRLAYLGRRKDGLLGRTPGREEVLLPHDTCLILGADGYPPAQSAQDVLARALRFAGVPYLWGGTSGWGLDCSGLVQLALATAGVRLPRDSDQQFALAREIGFVAKVSSLQPGDLAFFPGHVGLHLGGGELLHASAQAGCVTVNALVPGAFHYSSSLARKFLGGGRFL